MSRRRTAALLANAALALVVVPHALPAGAGALARPRRRPRAAWRRPR